MRSWPSADRGDHPTMSVDTPLWTLTAAEPLRIAYIPTFADAPVDPQIARSVAAAAEIFTAQGHRVVRLDATMHVIGRKPRCKPKYRKQPHAQ